MDEAGVYASQGYDRGEANNSMDQKDNQTQYTIQSVLHFIQSEWTRLELQRSQWEMERAELQARIAFLQGERRGQENIKQDLVRRIKMLEHALKQERVRYHQLKLSIDSYSEKPVDENSKPGPDSSMESKTDLKNIMDPGRQLALSTEQALQSNAKWRESRLKLKHFLQEVGYTDSVLAVRQSRVRQLLCSTNGDLMETDHSNDSLKKSSNRNSMVLPENEEAVLRNFDFLDTAPKPIDKTNPTVGADAEAPWNDDKPTPGGLASMLPGFDSRTGQSKRFGRKAGMDSHIMDFLNSLSDKEASNGEGLPKLNEAVWPPTGGAGRNSTVDGESVAPGVAPGMTPFNSVSQSEGEELSAVAGLGDLAGLTVSNDSDNGGFEEEACFTAVDSDHSETGGFPSSNSGFGQKPSTAQSATTGARRPWTKKFGLRGHFDGVRSIAFHPSEPYLFSSGEDGLVMLWALRKPGSPKPSVSNVKNGNQLAAALVANAPPDLDPVHIYRGHNGPVLSVSVPAVGQCGSAVYSSGMDGFIRGWRLPSPDPFTGVLDLYSLTQTINECGPLLRRPDSTGDAVWSISVHPSLPLLASVDTSSAVSFWSLESDVPIGDDTAAVALPIDPITPSRTIFLNELILPSGSEAAVGRPTCITFFNSRPDPTNSTQCLVSTSTGWLALIDMETGKVVNKAPPPTESPTGGPATDSEFGSDPFTTQAAPIDTNAITYPKASWGPRGIYSVAMYQTFSLAITGHEDRCIRFYDLTRQGGNADKACVATVVTHLEAVTCLTVDPHDLYVLTGSHDSSIRLWDLESRACVQEMTCHRVKNNESVHAVAMHPTMPFAASAGADAICKVYTSL
nr:striatin [Hymenolepis microstoma]